MLRLFEVPEALKPQLRSMSPTSETMRNALILIGNPDIKTIKNNNKLTDFGK